MTAQTGWDDPLSVEPLSEAELAEAAREAEARRRTLEDAFREAVRTVLLRIQRLGAAERAIDQLLTDGLDAARAPQQGLPRVELEEWCENRPGHLPPFTPPIPVFDPPQAELGEVRRTLVYLRGVLGLQEDAAGEALKKLLNDADAEGIYVPTTLNPVAPPA